MERDDLAIVSIGVGEGGDMRLWGEGRVVEFEKGLGKGKDVGFEPGKERSE